MDGELVATCEPAGAGTTGDACNEWSDCARGYGCPDGRCRKLCCGADWSDSACEPGEGCYRELRNGFTVAIQRNATGAKFVTRWGARDRGGLRIEAREALYFIREPFSSCQ